MKEGNVSQSEDSRFITGGRSIPTVADAHPSETPLALL
jgi:hypothetical protein